MWSAVFRGERACEVLRNSLRQRPYFNIKMAYAHLDTANKGYVAGQDIRDFLAENGFYATEREVAGLIAKADRSGDATISFNEFVDEFQPKLGM